MKRKIFFQLHEVLPFSKSVLHHASVFRPDKSLSGQKIERKNAQNVLKIAGDTFFDIRIPELCIAMHLFLHLHNSKESEKIFMIQRNPGKITIIFR